MKNLIALILSLTFVLALAGCGKTTGSGNPVVGGGEPVAGGADMPTVENDGVIQTEQTQPAVTGEKWDLIPMVMVDGVLYLDTGYANTDIKKCGTPDGEITSKVDGSEKPTTNDQSNFGTGYGYQYGVTEGTIEVYMNDEWRIFATEEVQQQIQFQSSKDEIPSISEVSQMKYSEVNKVLSGKDIQAIRDTWGEPIESDGKEDEWQLDESMLLIIAYNDTGIIESCELVCGTPLAPTE